MIAAIISVAIIAIVLFTAVVYAVPISFWFRDVLDYYPKDAWITSWSDELALTSTISFWLFIVSVLLLLILVVLIVLLAVYLSRGKDDRKP